MRTHVTSIPVARETAPQTPPEHAVVRAAAQRTQPRARRCRGRVAVVRPVAAAPRGATGSVAPRPGRGGGRAPEPGDRTVPGARRAAVRSGPRSRRAGAGGIPVALRYLDDRAGPEAGPSGTSLRGRGRLQGPTRVFPDSPSDRAVRCSWTPHRTRPRKPGHRRAAGPPHRPPTSTAPPSPAAGHGHEMRLHRRRGGRMLGGVAVGLADYFDVDPVLVRVGFVVLPSWAAWPCPSTWPAGRSSPTRTRDTSIAEEILARERAPAPTETHARHRSTSERLPNRLRRPRRPRRTDALPLGPRLPDGPAGRAALDAGLRAPTTSATRSPTSCPATTRRAGSTRPSSRRRLDTAMSATTRGHLNGLFHDLPRLPEPPATADGTAPCPGSSSSPSWPWSPVATLPFYPLYHVPWFLFAIVGFILWRRAAGGPWHHHITAAGGPSSAMAVTDTEHTEKGPDAHPRPPPRAHPGDPSMDEDLAPRCMRYRSSPACPTTSSRSSPPSARSAPPTPARSSRPRTCPFATGTSSPAATRWSSATAPRSGCSGGVTPGPSMLPPELWQVVGEVAPEHRRTVRAAKAVMPIGRILAEDGFGGAEGWGPS